jgi:hypothetical protein
LKYANSHWRLPALFSDKHSWAFEKCCQMKV